MSNIKLEDDKNCFVCGNKNSYGLQLRFTIDKDNAMHTEFMPQKHHQGFKDIVHGGLIGLILDEIMVNLAWKMGKNAVTAEFNVRLKKIAKKFSRSFKIEIEGVQKPYLLVRSHPLVKQLEKAFRALKLHAEIKGSAGATVITFFQKQNIPAVATGFGSAGCAHSAGEYAKIENLYRGAEALEYFLKNYHISPSP